MEIFLSHNHKDKPIVEPIAIRLREVFGFSSIFYDSWSIKPGDGIIDKMNEGLEKADFFFFFISENSLSSEMVKLEWQNALMKRTQNGKMRFIPVRIDRSIVPPILSQTLYIDFYSNGFEVGVKQIFDVLTNSMEDFKYTEFENLTAYRQIIGEDGLCERLIIHANYFMEPTAQFLIGINTSKDNMLIQPECCISDAFFLASKPESVFPGIDGFSKITIGISRAITKDNPFIFDIKIREKIVHEKVINCVFHIKGPQSKQALKVFDIPIK